MTIILPEDYHAQRALENNKIECITEEEARKEDIRALRIGILNIMPEAQTYEFNLLQPLGRSILQIVPVWIKLESHNYSSSNPFHLERLYVSLDEALKQGPIDGFIVTGAPVETLEFEDVRYWDEIKEILVKSGKTIPSTLGICWGAMALGHILGLEKVNYDSKLFGVFETINLNRRHDITGGLDDVFWLPQSRHAGFSNESMEDFRDRGILNLLAYSEDAGYPIFESFDQRYIMNMGHFEYNAMRLVEEALRDRKRADVPPPQNLDLEKPLNRWRGQRNEFFAQWVKYCHSNTQNEPYRLNQ